MVAILVTPAYVAEIVAEPRFLLAVVAVNVPDVAPAATRTVAGSETRAGLELESVTAAPPPGAGAESVTLPPNEAPAGTLALASVIDASAVESARVTVNVVVRVTPR